MPVEVVVVDTMTFSYLQGLRHLDLIRQVGLETRKLAVTEAVLKQLHRSGNIGPLVQSYCDRLEIRLISPAAGDDISRSVADVLRRKDGALVRKNRVDAEVVEVARAQRGAVLTREGGIHALARARRVAALDLLDFFEWTIRLGLLRVDEVETIVKPWTTKSADGTGCPADFQGTLVQTASRRPALPGLLEELLARPEPEGV